MSIFYSFSIEHSKYFYCQKCYLIMNSLTFSKFIIPLLSHFWLHFIILLLLQFTLIFDLIEVLGHYIYFGLHLYLISAEPLQSSFF